MPQCFSVQKFCKEKHQTPRKICRIHPHPKSLDGTNAPSQEELTRLGFSDVNITLANTVEALGNARNKTRNENNDGRRNR